MRSDRKALVRSLQPLYDLIIRRPVCVRVCLSRLCLHSTLAPPTHPITPSEDALLVAWRVLQCFRSPPAAQMSALYTRVRLWWRSRRATQMTCIRKQLTPVESCSWGGWELFHSKTVSALCTVHVVENLNNTFNATMSHCGLNSDETYYSSAYKNHKKERKKHTIWPSQVNGFRAGRRTGLCVCVSLSLVLLLLTWFWRLFRSASAFRQPQGNHKLLQYRPGKERQAHSS